MKFWFVNALHHSPEHIYPFLIANRGEDILLLKVAATFVTVMTVVIRGCFIDKLISMSQLQKFKGISNAQIS
jgi:hypothetical protein